MGDLVTCTATLWGPDEKGVEWLMLTVLDGSARILPVRPKGTPRRAEKEPEWEYDYRGGDVLHMQPSLLCPDTGPPPFHTDFHWTVKFERVSGESGYDKFYELNPHLRHRSA